MRSEYRFYNAMKLKHYIAVVFAGVLFCQPTNAFADGSLKLSIGPAGNELLRGADARTQLVVTGEASDGSVVDLTSSVSYECSPEGVIEIDALGFVTPLSSRSLISPTRSCRFLPSMDVMGEAATARAVARTVFA